MSACLVGVGAQWNAKGAGEAKICELQVALLVDEQVLRLEVAVQDAVAVAVAHALYKLRHELLDHVLAEAERLQVRRRAVGQRLTPPAVGDRQRLHVLFQVEVEELKDEVELVPVGVHYVEQSDNVGVVHLLEERDFADRRRRDAFVFGLEADLLQGHDSAGAEVARFVHHAIGPCSVITV